MKSLLSLIAFTFFFMAWAPTFSFADVPDGECNHLLGVQAGEQSPQPEHQRSVMIQLQLKKDGISLKQAQEILEEAGVILDSRYLNADLIEVNGKLILAGWATQSAMQKVQERLSGVQFFADVQFEPLQDSGAGGIGTFGPPQAGPLAKDNRRISILLRIDDRYKGQLVRDILTQYGVTEIKTLAPGLDSAIIEGRDNLRALQDSFRSNGLGQVEEKSRSLPNQASGIGHAPNRPVAVVADPDTRNQIVTDARERLFHQLRDPSKLSAQLQEALASTELPIEVEIFAAYKWSDGWVYTELVHNLMDWAAQGKLNLKRSEPDKGIIVIEANPEMIRKIVAWQRPAPNFPLEGVQFVDLPNGEFSRALRKMDPVIRGKFMNMTDKDSLDVFLTVNGDRGTFKRVVDDISELGVTITEINHKSNYLNQHASGQIHVNINRLSLYQIVNNIPAIDWVNQRDTEKDRGP